MLVFLLPLLMSACNYTPPKSPAAQPSATLIILQTPGCDATTAQPGGCLPTDTASMTTDTATPEGTPTSEPTASPTPGSTGTPVQRAAVSLPLQPTACPPDYCVYSGPLFLQRPIRPPGRDRFDLSYRFGSTQSGKRDPHHGVEFLNPFGTPVLAAGEGTVVVAGSDINPTSAQGAWPITFYGPYSNFYGNLVVIEHRLPAGVAEAIPGLPQPVYTLYGHLSEVGVQADQSVQAGQEIGKVGQAGIATGSHLHFEVRLGENSYKTARNPELWLAPTTEDAGELPGAIAGSFIDHYGNSLEMPSIVLEHLPAGPEGASDFQTTVITYEEKGLRGLPPWNESFAVGDLPAGWYRISFPMGGLREELVQVLPGQVTVVTFRYK